MLRNIGAKLRDLRPCPGTLRRCLGVLTGADEEELQIVAELIEVLS